MSSNPTGEKTEPPTPKKLRDARKKGQVARSQEVVTTVSLFAVIALMIGTGRFAFQKMVEMMDIVAMMAQNPTRTRMTEGVNAMMDAGTAILLPILSVTIFAGIAANYLQIGSLFSFESVKPKLEKISPSKGMKRIFSMKQLVEVLKSIVKIVFLSVLLYFVIRAAIGPFIVSVSCGMACIAPVTMRMLLLVVGLSAFAFVVVAAADFVFQKHIHIKGLKMTKEEVKREYKESEGDPIVKSQRKQFAQELIFSDPPAQARKATAVIINPVHLAVAIRYDEAAKDIPIVVAKGRNTQAIAIRAAAEDAGVPVFRNVPLARTMFAQTALGEAVPSDVFEVVAVILAWIARHKDALYAGPLPHGVIDMERDPAFASAPAG
ncbi:MAG: type III secretion system export apparatus subunit SctU [Pseudomonadota bacterium]